MEATGTDRVQPDRRPEARRSAPKSQLTPEERQRILDVCNQAEFASLPPSQIVPKLADQGLYLASESTFYRVLKAAGQLQHRGRTQKRSPCSGPRTHVAQGPNQVWMWDITVVSDILARSSHEANVSSGQATSIGKNKANTRPNDFSPMRAETLVIPGLGIFEGVV